MKNQAPSFQWYPRDWLTSRAVTKMSPTQRAYYFDLLNHAWLSDRPGFIPNDPDLLWRLARAETREAFERESEIVLAQFKKSTAKGQAWLWHPRLATQCRAYAQYRDRMATRGRAGANARWNNKIDASGMPSDGSASASASASAKLKHPPLPPMNGGNGLTHDDLLRDEKNYAVMPWRGEAIVIRTNGKRRVFTKRQEDDLAILGHTDYVIERIRSWGYWCEKYIAPTKAQIQ